MTQRVRVALLLLCAAGGNLYQAWAVTHDPCTIYSTYNDDYRDAAREADTDYCDDQLREGWYTFQLNNNAAFIPTTCMQEKTCGTEVPFHVDLDGQDMPAVGKIINASLCGSARVLDTVECCVLPQEIRIKRCASPAVIIYYLKPLRHCPSAICSLLVGTEVDRKFRFESGDDPLSFQTTTPATTSTVFIPSTDSSSPALNNTTELTDSSSPNATEASSQENTTVPVSSTDTTVATTNSTAGMASVTANHSTDPPMASSITATPAQTTSMTATPSVDQQLREDSYHLQLMLLVEDYKGPGVLDVLRSMLKKVVRLSEADGISSDSIRVSECCSGPGAFTAHVTITSTSNHTAGGGYTVRDVVDLKALQNSLPGDVGLLAACTMQGGCEQPEKPRPFKLLLLILIILMTLVATALLVYCFVRLYKHCSKRGTWVPPPDQKGDAESVDTSKPTDTVNGGDPPKSPSANGPDGGKPDDAGWWVVPLDQAPGNEDVEDQKTTQETRM